MEVCPLCQSRNCRVNNPVMCITFRRLRKAPDAPAADKMIRQPVLKK